MFYAISEALGYHFFLMVFIFLGWKSKRHSWMMYCIGVILQLISYGGMIAEKTWNGEEISIIYPVIFVVLAVSGAVLIMVKKKKGSTN